MTQTAPCYWCGMLNQYTLTDDHPLCQQCNHRADLDTLACDCKACSGRWAIPNREEYAVAWLRGEDAQQSATATEANIVRAILGDVQVAESLTDRIRRHAESLLSVPRSRANLLRDACEASARLQVLWSRALSLAEELEIPVP